MMESMGVRNILSRSEFGCGVVVKDTYCCGFNWCEFVSIGGQYFRMEERQLRGLTPPPAAAAAAAPTAMDSMMMCGITDAQKMKTTMMPPCPQHTSWASHTPILSVLGDSTRSYPRLNTISTGFVDALLSRQRNIGYFAGDVMAGTYNPRER
jgi:hypothetical protein